MQNPNNRLLIDAIAYHFLSFRKLNAKRIMGIGFLCDWKHCIEYGKPITDCDWSILGNWVHSEVFLASLYKVDYLQFSDMRLVAPPVMMRRPKYPFGKGSTEDFVCQHVFSVLDKINEFEMDKVILSTYPFDRSGPINMIALSKEYASKYGRQYTTKKRA